MSCCFVKILDLFMLNSWFFEAREAMDS
jgi:hypothetical protein